MSGGANVFIIKSGDLGASWSPEYHDFKIQYKAIHDRLFEHPLDAIEWWNTVRANGRLKLKDDHTLFLHPDVIKYVDTLLIAGSDEHVMIKDVTEKDDERR